MRGEKENRTKELGRKLRLQMTPSEVGLWKILKNKQLDGLKFRRQYAVEGFILDFYCPQLALGIELDGQVHVGRDEEDDIRSCRLQAQKGISILRYENRVVYEQPEAIIQGILQFAEEHPLKWRKKSVGAATTPPVPGTPPPKEEGSWNGKTYD